MAEQVILLTAFLLLIITLVKFIFIFRRRESDVYILLALAGLLYNSAVLYLILSGQITRFAHLFRTGALASYVMMSATFLFIRKSVFKQKFTDTDLLFFMPLAFYLTDMMPVLIQSTEIKRQILTGQITDNAIGVYHHGWLIGFNSHYFLLNLWGAFLAIWQIAMILYKLKTGGHGFYKENKGIVLWFSVWSLGMFFSCCPDAVQALTGYKAAIFSQWYFSPAFLMNFLIPFSILASPSILRGIKGNWVYVPEPSRPLSLAAPEEIVIVEEEKEEVVEFDNADTDVASLGRVYFKVEHADKIKAELDGIMQKTRAYLNPAFNINELSRESGYSPRLLSSLLNNYALVSYTDYVNRYRIKHFIDEYASDVRNSKKTLEQWAMECGFQNRFTFSNAFKRVTGLTPSKYFSKDSGQ